MYTFPLEVVGLMVTLLLLVIELPPGPVQLIITELDLTPLIVVTLHCIFRKLPTIAPRMEPDGDVVIVGVGTKNNLIYQCTYLHCTRINC